MKQWHMAIFRYTGTLFCSRVQTDRMFYLQLLVDYLVKPARDDEVGKIRALFRWITARLMEKSSGNTNVERGSAIWYIRQIKEKSTA